MSERKRKVNACSHADAVGELVASGEEDVVLAQGPVPGELVHGVDVVPVSAVVVLFLVQLADVDVLEGLDACHGQGREVESRNPPGLTPGRNAVREKRMVRVSLERELLASGHPNGDDCGISQLPSAQPLILS
jgi:hypothetical protein